MEPVSIASLSVAAAKLILPPLTDKAFAFRKTVPPRTLRASQLADFKEWMKILNAVESYGEPPEGAEERKAQQTAIHETYCKAAARRAEEYEKLMLEELTKKTIARNAAGTEGVTTTDQLILTSDEIDHAARSRDYAQLHKLAMTEAEAPFVFRDGQTVFDCSREDIACRSLIIILQYSLLLCKKQEFESRQFLIRAVASLPEKIVKNRNYSRIFNGHLWRELMIDLVSIQAWEAMPGHYLPWSFYHGVCVEAESMSAKLLTLLLLRTMRHVALLLESIRRSEHRASISEVFIDDTLAISRFERSLLWETTCSILEAQGRSVSDLSSYEFQGELRYPEQTDPDGHFIISPDERDRVKLGCALYSTMVEHSVSLVQNVAKSIRQAVPSSKTDLLGRRKRDELEKSLVKYSEFRELLELFVGAAKVIHDTFSKPKRHLQHYAVRVKSLASCMIAYRYSRDVSFAVEAAKLKGTVETLRSRLIQEVQIERTL